MSEAYQKAIVLFNDEVIGFSDMKSRLLLTFFGESKEKISAKYLKVARISEGVRFVV